MNLPRYATAIEGRLADDETGALRRQLRMQLRAEIRQLDDQLARPQPPDDFARLQRLRAACTAALDTVETIWRRARKRDRHEADGVAGMGEIPGQML